MCHPFPAKDQNRIQISLLDKLQKLKISFKVTQMTQNPKVAIGLFYGPILRHLNFRIDHILLLL
jgi:hypothetical protein